LKNIASLSYDQSVIINGFKLSGVNDINGGYSLRKSPLNVLGGGYAQNGMSGPPEGNFSFSRGMICVDPLSNLTGDIGFSGGFQYLDKSFSFTSGYLTTYSVSCSVGEIPQINTDIAVFGDIGSGISVTTTGAASAIQVPNQGSITVTCGGSTTNRVTSFNYNINVQRDPIYKTNQLTPAQVNSVKPIELNADFTLSVSDYEVEALLTKLTSPSTENISVSILANDLSTNLQTFNIPNAHLVTNPIAASVGGDMAVTLSYVGYAN
jgi:hypothetical protein